jgi:hypothetical protein
MTLESSRQRTQLEFIASGRELAVGAPRNCPLPPEQLARTRGDEPYVVATHDAGLTARVFRVRLGGRDWALKIARAEARVRNVDGRTSFLNELQRRSEFEALKSLPGGRERFAGIADTTYASLRLGLIVSPWIAGGAPGNWDARRLTQLFETGIELIAHGFFEWDLSPGNLLDDGVQLRLFDFGYLYRFDPRKHFNSAGDGTSAPQFHLAERFETRNYFVWLLELEAGQGTPAALAAYRLEKSVALDAYRRLHARLAAQQASATVLDWLDRITRRWNAALASDLGPLYLAEGWRSHRLDLDDDLHGRSCTPMTLRRADWLLAALRGRFGELQRANAFDAEESAMDVAALLRRYEARRRQAQAWQLSSIP